ncbi:hypothetical protein Barb4_00008 [Bacteroidales bacterium Barb4]|nr:hypothetical protein Barb4_00008 [Bacteroidales bacterium Barb4]
MIQMRSLLLIAALCFSLPGMAQSAYHVSPYGTAGNAGTSWDDAVTLQAALSAAADGDTIRIAKGNYHTANARGAWQVAKSVTIIGGYDETEDAAGKPPENPSATILYGNRIPDGNGKTTRVISIIGTADHIIRVTVENLTMTGGNGTYDVYASGRGGGLYNRYSETVLRGVVISGNTASDDGSNDAFGGGICNEMAVLTITENSVIQNNIASADGVGSAFGGGISNSGSLTVDGNTRIENNTASAGTGAGSGGGIFSSGETAKLFVSHSVIIGNKAVDNPSGDQEASGGGIDNTAGSYAELAVGTVVKDNIATTGLGIGFGGGVSNTSFSALLFFAGLVTSNTAISNLSNTAEARGGGIYNDNLSTLEWEDLTAFIHSNTATAGSGTSTGTDIYSKYAYNVFFPVVEHITSDREIRTHAVKNGGTFWFTLKTDSDNKDQTQLVLANDRPLTPSDSMGDGMYQYTLTITEDVVFYIAFKSIITLPDIPLMPGFTLTPDPGEYITRSDGTFTFSLQKEKKYKGIEPVVRIGETLLLPSGIEGDTIYRYSLLTKEDADIQITTNRHVVMLSDPPQGLSLTTDQPLVYATANNTFAFTLNVTDDRFKYILPTVLVNGISTMPTGKNDGSYRYILDIRGYTDVQIEFKHHSVTVPYSPTSVTMNRVPGRYDIQSDSAFNFTLTVTDSKLADIAPFVAVNGNPLLFSGKQGSFIYLYSLKTTEDVLIRIEADYYAVTFAAPPESVAAVTPEPGKYFAFVGTDFTFTLNPKEQYLDACLEVVAGNDTIYPVRDSNGGFTMSLSGLRKDISVTAFLFYKVVIHPSIFIDMDILPGEYKVVPGSDFIFKLKPYEQYTNIVPTVVVNGNIWQLLPVESDGWYTISLPATKDTDIQIQLLPEASLFPANAVKIYSHGGNLAIESAAGEIPVTVTTLAGRVKARQKVAGTKSIALPAGIYIVRAGVETRKITVR